MHFLILISNTDFEFRLKHCFCCMCFGSSCIPLKWTPCCTVWSSGMSSQVKGLCSSDGFLDTVLPAQLVNLLKRPTHRQTHPGLFLNITSKENGAQLPLFPDRAHVCSRKSLELITLTDEPLSWSLLFKERPLDIRSGTSLTRLFTSNLPGGQIWECEFLKGPYMAWKASCKELEHLQSFKACKIRLSVNVFAFLHNLGSFRNLSIFYFLQVLKSIHLPTNYRLQKCLKNILMHCKNEYLS